MSSNLIKPLTDPITGEHLSPRDFSRLSRFVFDTTGIHLPASKKILLEGRIHKRMRQLKMHSIAGYCEYVLSPEGQDSELELFINSVTTNKTDFFREEHHFHFIEKNILPVLLKKRKNLSFWSAACSRGAEPYTLAMVLENYTFQHPTSGLTYEIFATDIATDVLQYALQGIYTEEEIAPIPDAWRKRYVLRSRDPSRQHMRIHPQIRSKVNFGYLNLMEHFPWKQTFDVIFCRNVTIYFTAQTRSEVVLKLLRSLKKDGYLIMGHSETLDTNSLPIVSVGPSIYQKK